MEITEIIVIIAIVLIVGGAVAYIIKAKKSGNKCIGCPYSGSCGKSNTASSCGGSCHSCSCGCASSTAVKDENNSPDADAEGK